MINIKTIIAAILSLILAATSMQAQTLPRVGQVLWEVSNPYPTGGIALAEGAGLLFGGAQDERIYVLDAKTGEARDTIKMSDWSNGKASDRFSAVVDISCSRDGKVLALIVARNEKVCKVLLMDYPSKRIIKDSMFYGSGFGADWGGVRVKVSPSGRYVIVPDSTRSVSVPNYFYYQMRLHDLQEDTSYLVDARSYYRCDFDDAEHQMVFVSSGSIGSVSARNRVSIATIGNGAPTFRHTKECGFCAVSGDGRHVMASGYGLPIGFGPDPVTGPRASVTEIETGKVIWSITGDFTGENDDDFQNPSWSKDAARFFCLRDSKQIPADWRGFVFYNVGDSVPLNKMSDTSKFFGNSWSVYAGATNNSALTIGFTNGRGEGGLRAESLIPSTSSVPDFKASQDSNTVYPNPMTGVITVTCPGKEATTWVLFSVDGREVARGALAPTPVREKIAYTFVVPASVGSGAYVLQLRSQTKPLCSKKVVVQ